LDEGLADGDSTGDCEKDLDVGVALLLIFDGVSSTFVTNLPRESRTRAFFSW
jgi:hypothetical protein